jgi:tetratricopeptide (TPR) repeat protein
MLKPKRKMYQKELKRDPLLEGVSSLQQNLETHSKLYGKVVIGVIAIVLIAIVVSRNMNAKSEEAKNIMSRAMVLFEQGDVDNALLEFETISDGYGNTGSGKLSAFYLGRLYFDRGEFELAETYMTNYVKNPEVKMLTATAYSILAKLAEFDEDYSSAIAHSKNAVKTCTIDSDRNHHSLSLASLYILDDESSEAFEILDVIIKETNPNDPIRAKAERLKGQL